MDKFKKLLKPYQDKIDTELNIFFSKKLRKVSSIDGSSTDLIKKIREFNLRGGKRIRPILVILGHSLISNRNRDQITKAALAVELMESFLLIHDDIIDNDSLRRGKPTLHKIYEKEKNNPEYGKNMALLAGDLLAVFGSEVILNTSFKSKLKNKAVEKFNTTLINTIFGQTMDYISNFKKDYSEKSISNIHLLKTAKYTVEGPLHIGAILAGGKKRHLKKISAFAMPLGRAFQIKDDILGLFADEEKLGKPVGSDIKEGKKTLLIIKALENCNIKDRTFIKSRLGNKDLNKTDLERIRKIVIDTGSLKYSEDLAENLANKAKKIIKTTRFKKQPKEFLCLLADYIIKREN